jgi:30S ribosome assembly GTPase
MLSQISYGIKSRVPFFKRRIDFLVKRCLAKIEIPPPDGEGWVTYHIGSEEEVQNADMDRRILAARELEAQEKKVGQGRGIKKLPLSGKLSSKDSFAAIKKNQNVDKISGYLEINPFLCPGCGTAFQSKHQDSPGFLPPDKFADHQKQASLLREKQEALKILRLADIDLNSPNAKNLLISAKINEKIIDSILAIGKSVENPELETKETKVSPATKSLPTNLENRVSVHDNEVQFADSSFFGGLTKKVIEDIVSKSELKNSGNYYPVKPVVKRDSSSFKNASILNEEVCICQRCYRLQQYGQVESNLRPGWSQNELLTPQRFENILSSIKKTKAIVLCLVDIFDLEGSVIPKLREIAGENPVVIGVNKIDLLPNDISEIRVRSWVHQELKRICGFVSPKDRESENFISASAENVLKLSNIHLISCATNYGLSSLMSNVIDLAKDHGNQIFVMGAANVGKSSFINYLLDPYNTANENRKKKSRTPLITVSNLPGTTLDFVKIKLPNGMTVVDTPGLLQLGHLTSRLTTEELRQIIPRKPINAVTFRLMEKKCVLLGAVARIELLEGRPFFFTFYVSNEVKLHVTDATKAENFINDHIGNLIFPPQTLQRLEALGPYKVVDLEIEGDSWEKAGSDIVIPGLGFVTVTGPGKLKVRVTVPEGTEVTLRQPLLPYEAKHTTAKYSGGRIIKKSKKAGRKSYGWRA